MFIEVRVTTDYLLQILFWNAWEILLKFLEGHDDWFFFRFSHSIECFYEHGYNLLTSFVLMFVSIKVYLLYKIPKTFRKEAYIFLFWIKHFRH